MENKAFAWADLESEWFNARLEETEEFQALASLVLNQQQSQRAVSQSKTPEGAAATVIGCGCKIWMIEACPSHSPEIQTNRAGFKEQDIDPLWSAAELVKIGLVGTPHQAYEYARTGILPCIRIGRRVLFSPKQIRDFIAEGGRGLPGGWRRDSR